MSRTGSQSTWTLLEAMDWDNSDVRSSAPPVAGSKRRPPPIPVKVKDASGKPIGGPRLPGVHEEVPSPDRRSGNPNGQNNLGRRRGDKETRQLFVPNSFDVTVPGDGTYRVPAQSAIEARNALITWFAEDQEPGHGRQLDPGTLQVVRTPLESQTEAFEDFKNTAWNVRNKKTGQVFTHIAGRTPMDAKRQVLANNPNLRNVTPLDLEADPMSDGGMGRSPQSIAQGNTQTTRAMSMGQRPDDFDSDETTLAEPPRPAGASPHPQPGARMRDTEPLDRGIPSIANRKARMRPEGASVGAMGANGPAGRDRFKEAVKTMVREIVRKKAGGGGYALYAPNKGKKKSPKPVGEFPTRLAAKNAELARFPPKDPEALKAARAKLDKLRKDPKKQAAAERADLSGRKKPKRTGVPARDRKKRQESFVRLMARDLHERLFSEAGFGLGKSGKPKHPSDLEDSPSRQGSHYPRSSAYDKAVPDRNPKKSRRDHMTGRPVTERLFHDDEVPGSPWDEKISSLHPDAISSDRKLHALHRGMEKASIGALGDAHKGLSKVLRGVVKVNPGDIAFDSERKKTFMPVMLDCDGMEIGPVHLYVDGGHIKIEVSREAREAIAQLEPDTARDVRGGLMSFEEDHLPKIDGAQKAWAERDRYLDKLHGRLEKHASEMSGVEHHLMKGLLTKGGKGK